MMKKNDSTNGKIVAEVGDITVFKNGDTFTISVEKKKNELLELAIDQPILLNVIQNPFSSISAIPVTSDHENQYINTITTPTDVALELAAQLKMKVRTRTGLEFIPETVVESTRPPLTVEIHKLKGEAKLTMKQLNAVVIEDFVFMAGLTETEAEEFRKRIEETHSLSLGAYLENERQSKKKDPPSSNWMWTGQ